MVPNCPFCRANHLLRGEVLAETEVAYLVPALDSAGNFLIIPQHHVEAPAELPEGWWRAVADLLAKVPGLGPDYNLAMNVGALAGQSVRHLHLWIIPRIPGRPSSGKGLARLMYEADQG